MRVSEIGNITYDKVTIIATTISSNGSAAYINGGLAVNSSGTYSTNTVRDLRVGAGATESTTAQNFYNGDIAEVMVLDHALTTAERQAMEQYMSLKWGVALQ